MVLSPATHQYELSTIRTSSASTTQDGRSNSVSAQSSGRSSRDASLYPTIDPAFRPESDLTQTPYLPHGLPDAVLPRRRPAKLPIKFKHPEAGQSYHVPSLPTPPTDQFPLFGLRVSAQSTDQIQRLPFQSITAQRSHLTPASQVETMVYPPQPPVRAERYPSASHSSTSSIHGQTSRPFSSSLPSVGTWIPPPFPSPGSRAGTVPRSPERTGTSSPAKNGVIFPHVSSYYLDQSPAAGTNGNGGSADAQLVTPGSGRKRPRSRHDRHSSDADEVAAGLALAGLGSGLNGGEMTVGSTLAGKKAKSEEKGKKAGEKETRKSCSECRRLKAKCDRVFPCSNCRRRGCALVCPDGDLSCMQGKRLVLASTEQLHERIAQLETALFQAHSQTSSAHHPLLAPEHLDGGLPQLLSPPHLSHTTSSITPPEDISGPTYRYDSVKKNGPISGLFSPPGEMQHRSVSRNRMAVGELLLNEDAAAPEGKREEEWVGENAAPAMIVSDWRKMRLTQLIRDQIGDNADSSDEQDEKHRIVDRLRSLLRALPSRQETQRRSRNFFKSSPWYNGLLRKPEFDAIYEPAVYAPTPANPLSPHKLATVLMVLTLDTYFDLSVDRESPAVAEYWEAVQKCFDTRFGWAASIAGVQALGLAALFVGFGWRGARASNHYWLRQMTSAAQQLGLHKDPHPALPEDEREFRRRVFHEMYAVDCLVSLNHGQRVAVPEDNVECIVPIKGISVLEAVKYKYMRSVQSAVIEVGCRPDSNPATPEQVTAIDASLNVLDITVQPGFHCPSLQGKPVPNPAENPNNVDVESLVKCMTSMCHYKAMLFLYRPSLRRLIGRLRIQPRETISFVDFDRETVSKTYGACHAIIVTATYVVRTHPRLAARTWTNWVQCFSAAVSMAALAIWCAPHLEASFVNSAYAELSKACEMIASSGSKRSQSVLSLLPVLQNLVSNRFPSVDGRDQGTAKVSVEGEDMLFALLGGEVGLRQPSHPPREILASQIPQPVLNDYWRSQPVIEQQMPNTYNGPEAFASHYIPHDYGSGQIQLTMQSAAIPIDLTASANFAQPPGLPMEEQNIDAQELWARFQTFYEPTPAFWGPAGVGSYVDYPSMVQSGSGL